MFRRKSNGTHQATNPQPRLVLFGAQPRVQTMVALYQLEGKVEFAVSDRRPGMVGTHIAGREVLNFDSLALSNLEAVIITEDPVGGEFAQAVAFLKEKGVPTEKISSIGQPGKAHRAISALAPTSTEHNREIGYGAIRANLFHRGNYAYCMILAAESALRMSLTHVTAVEFGVWYGSGLKNMCEIADFIHQTIGVKFYIYGFDTGAGLPEVADWRDHPELWGSGTLVMPNFEELASELPENCKLIIGNCKDTLPVFLEEHTSSEAPIGFVSLDVDQYHSSVSALKIFEAEPTHLMPVVPMWVDDSYLSILQTTFAGEGLAIREFNDQHDLRKIEQKIIRTDDFPRLWHHCIYFAHIFDHPVRQGRAVARFDQFYHTSY